MSGDLRTEGEKPQIQESQIEVLLYENLNRANVTVKYIDGEFIP
jgi:hypothetical protein